MTKTTISRNWAKCLNCNMIIESKTRHDMRWCKCRSIFVDGGSGKESDYWRYGGKPEHFQRLDNDGKPVEDNNDPAT